MTPEQAEIISALIGAGTIAILLAMPYVWRRKSKLEAKKSFAEEVVIENERARLAVEENRRQRDGKKEELYGEALQIKERLSKFALDNKLDIALLYGFEHLTWIASNPPEEYSHWGLTNLNVWEGQNELGGSDTSIAFNFGDTFFEIHAKKSLRSSYCGGNYDAEFYVDISLTEGHEVVFAVSFSTEAVSGLSEYSTREVTTCIQQGTWAKMLISLRKHGQLRPFTPDDALESIKSRFKE
ncbi:MAG: hypothetical protein ACK5OQ_15475 [Burkholderiales bacterium]|jgi:hypothetical protein